jgi:hypothetical protein
MKRLAALAVLLLALPACGGGTQKSTSPGPRATYGQIDDLVDAVTDAGLACDRWLKPKRERLAADSRYCKAPSAAVSIYTSPEDQQKAIRESKQFAVMWRKYGDEPSSLLVGENWIVEGSLDEVKTLEPALGGVVQDNSCAVAKAPQGGC